MFAIASTTEYSAKAANPQCTSYAQHTPNQSGRMFPQAMCSMWGAASAAASIFFIQTGVVASVSLFVLLITLLSLLVLSLNLSGLTGLVLSLVGLLKELSPGTKAGD